MIYNTICQNSFLLLEEQLLTDKEFKQVKVEFSRLTGTPFLASQWLRGENGVAQVLLEREDGKKVTLEAFRNKDISGGNSSYEVVHQVVPDSSRVDRGDVSLLINGLPIIRFEGFTDVWEQRKLGEISRMYQPLTITGNDLLPDGVPVFGANGFIGFFPKLIILRTKLQFLLVEKELVHLAMFMDLCGLPGIRW